MRSVPPERRHVDGHALFEGVMEDAYRRRMAHIVQEIGMRLSGATGHVLGRALYAQRDRLPCSVEQARACPKCRRLKSRHFSRNGSRPPCMLTVWGEVPLRWPRLPANAAAGAPWIWMTGCASASAAAGMSMTRFSPGSPRA